MKAFIIFIIREELRHDRSNDGKLVMIIALFIIWLSYLVINLCFLIYKDISVAGYHDDLLIDNIGAATNNSSIRVVELVLMLFFLVYVFDLGRC